MQKVDNASEFNKSLQELRDLRSQIYHAADYCETTFLSAEDKRIVMENTKQCISRAIFAVCDHLCSISTNLESCLSKTISISHQTENKIDILKLRIVTCQQNSHKSALSRFYLCPDFSTHHCRYIIPPITDTETLNVMSRDTEGGVDAKRAKEEEFETDEPLFLHTYNCKTSMVENVAMDVEKKNGLLPQVCSYRVVPVRGDGLSILPKSEQSIFQFQRCQKLKRSMINWRQMQNKEVASLIRCGKKIIS